MQAEVDVVGFEKQLSRLENAAKNTKELYIEITVEQADDEINKTLNIEIDDQKLEYELNEDTENGIEHIKNIIKTAAENADTISVFALFDDVELSIDAEKCTEDTTVLELANKLGADVFKVNAVMTKNEAGVEEEGEYKHYTTREGILRTLQELLDSALVISTEEELEDFISKIDDLRELKVYDISLYISDDIKVNIINNDFLINADFFDELKNQRFKKELDAYVIVNFKDEGGDGSYEYYTLKQFILKDYELDEKDLETLDALAELSEAYVDYDEDDIQTLSDALERLELIY